MAEFQGRRWSFSTRTLCLDELRCRAVVMRMAKATEPTPGLELKASVVGIKPLIWRRLQVPRALTLAKLHRVLQSAFGWTNTHLHEFSVGKVAFGPPGADEEGGPRAIDDRRVKLSDLNLSSGRKLKYLYDFGDDWEVELTVVKLLPAIPGVALCLEGERSGPPDDCGGARDYADFVEALADPKHPEHDERKDWIGDMWDPEAFDLAQVNAELRRIR